MTYSCEFLCHFWSPVDSCLIGNHTTSSSFFFFFYIYLFIAMRYMKCGFSNFRIGWDGAMFLLAATQIPSIIKWVKSEKKKKKNEKIIMHMTIFRNRHVFFCSQQWNYELRSGKTKIFLYKLCYHRGGAINSSNGFCTYTSRLCVIELWWIFVFLPFIFR